MGAEGGVKGWKLSGLTDAQYISLLLAYDAEIRKDPYVLGATVFTAGPTPDWNQFATDSISARIPTGGTMPTTFTVGQGVKDLMAQNSDTPESDEHYVPDATGQVFKSETFGAKGLYVWSKQANKTVIIPFGKTVLPPFKVG